MVNNSLKENIQLTLKNTYNTRKRKLSNLNNNFSKNININKNKTIKKRRNKASHITFSNQYNKPLTATKEYEVNKIGIPVQRKSTTRYRLNIKPNNLPKELLNNSEYHSELSHLYGQIHKLSSNHNHMMRTINLIDAPNAVKSNLKRKVMRNISNRNY
jgi:hypothetical protein